ncbi:MAG: hypothetical protein M3O22_06340 [Pseudomonadota bacterium]|nr:hypothetical protein [Pseudomonadota bacterium]
MQSRTVFFFENRIPNDGIRLLGFIRRLDGVEGFLNYMRSISDSGVLLPGFVVRGFREIEADSDRGAVWADLALPDIQRISLEFSGLLFRSTEAARAERENSHVFPPLVMSF